MRVDVAIVVNGATHERSVKPNRLLTEFLREDLGFTGTHVACNNGICGSCTVLVDGEPVRACLMLAVQADGASVVTIEGLATRATDGTQTLHPLQRAFVEHGAVQCGFCIPGMIMSAKSLLDSNSSPTTEQIKRALEGNLCRCTGYVKIVKAVAAAAGVS
jgi:aerobic carbon-monoxide dehydrogenase small subunit